VAADRATQLAFGVAHGERERLDVALRVAQVALDALDRLVARVGLTRGQGVGQRAAVSVLRLRERLSQRVDAGGRVAAGTAQAFDLSGGLLHRRRPMLPGDRDRKRTLHRSTSVFMMDMVVMGFTRHSTRLGAGVILGAALAATSVSPAFAHEQRTVAPSNSSWAGRTNPPSPAIPTPCSCSSTTPPKPYERGQKDVTSRGPNETVRVIMKFEHFTGRYVFHGHNLEHEDHDMMTQFLVEPGPR